MIWPSRDTRTSELREDPRRDPDRRGGERRADEDRRQGRETESARQAEPPRNGRTMPTTATASAGRPPESAPPDRSRDRPRRGAGSRRSPRSGRSPRKAARDRGPKGRADSRRSSPEHGGLTQPLAELSQELRPDQRRGEGEEKGSEIAVLHGWNATPSWRLPPGGLACYSARPLRVGL